LHAPNRAEAERFLQLTIKKYQEKSKGFAEWMENNIPESLTVMDFPEAHRRRLRTSNLAERVNKEVRRRTRVACIFPNTESCLRLVTAVIMEIDEEWIEGQVYLNFENKTEWNG
jgi:putative transposase